MGPPNRSACISPVSIRTGTDGSLRFLRGDYAFRDTWRAVGSVDQVASLLLDTQALSDWWPQLFAVRICETGGRDGASRAFNARVRGFMPYVLTLDFRVVEIDFPRRFAVELGGDLCGDGGGALRQEGHETVIEFDLRVQVARPLLQFFSLVARPLLHAQHRWVMGQGERGLVRALARRAAVA